MLSGCAIPGNPNTEGGIERILGDVLPPSETEFIQSCGERGGEVCGATEVCRGSIFWSVGSPLGTFSCCDMTCGEMTPDDECQTGVDCDDGNSSTRDKCSGNPMKCSHIEMLCDGPTCIYIRPAMEDPCEGVVCPSDQMCDRGECRPRICVEGDTTVIQRCNDEGCVTVPSKCVDGKYVPV